MVSLGWFLSRGSSASICSTRYRQKGRGAEPGSRLLNSIYSSYEPRHLMIKDAARCRERVSSNSPSGSRLSNSAREQLITTEQLQTEENRAGFWEKMRPPGPPTTYHQAIMPLTCCF